MVGNVELLTKVSDERTHNLELPKPKHAVRQACGQPQLLVHQLDINLRAIRQIMDLLVDPSGQSEVLPCVDRM